MNKLAVVKQENFGTVACDFFRDENNEVYMTREQIGKALSYAYPRKAISDIHLNHSDRLDKFSVICKIATENKGGVNRGHLIENGLKTSVRGGGLQETFLYNSKGVYEICRWSRQPKADAFMDFAWEVMESLRKGETVKLPTTVPTCDLNALQPKPLDVEQVFQLLNIIAVAPSERLPLILELAKQAGANVEPLRPSKLQQLRAEKGWSGWELALKSGVQYTYINEMENNPYYQAPIGTINVLARTLGVDSRILGGL